MIMKKLFVILTAIILMSFVIVFSVACSRDFGESGIPADTSTPTSGARGTPNAEITEVDRVRIEMESYELEKGTRFQPIVIIYPEDATDKRYELTSDNENVVRRHAGSWIAAGTGTATLTATATNGVTGSVLVTVVMPTAGIYLPEEEMTLNRGDVVTLGFTIGEQGDQVDDRITFSSDNESVATVSENGTITAVGAGVATITVTIGDASAYLRITVENPIRAINIELDRQVFTIGERVDFTVRTTPEDPTDDEYTVTFSGARIENIQQNSFVTAVSGEVVITATAENGVSGQRTVIVHDLAVFANEVLTLTNAERAHYGLSALVMDDTLVQVAMVRAYEIIQYFSHTRPDGTSFSTAFEEGNVPQGRWGENLAAGQRDPAEAIEGWMGSPSHREAILDASYIYIGIGVLMDNTGRLYWVQTFRN